MLEFSVHQSQGPRNSQEDRYVACAMRHGHLFAVLDGHGGHQVADYAASQIPSLFQRHLPIVPDSDKLIHEAFEATVEDLHKLIDAQFHYSGSTLSMAFVEPAGRDSQGVRFRVHAATMGDSPLALLTGSRLYAMQEHAVNLCPHDVSVIRENIEFLKQIQKPVPGLEMAGVQDGYVWSGVTHATAKGIAPTRVLGDYEHRDLLIRVPDIQTFEAKAGSVLMLATDGIRFDGPSKQRKSRYLEILGKIKEGLDACQIAAFARQAVNNDNLTLIAVDLTG